MSFTRAPEPLQWPDDDLPVLVKWWCREQRMTPGQIMFARLYAETGKKRDSAARAGYAHPKQQATRLWRDRRVRMLVHYIRSGETPELKPRPEPPSLRGSYDADNPEHMAELNAQMRAEKRQAFLDRVNRPGRRIRWRRRENAIAKLYETARRPDGEG